MFITNHSRANDGASILVKDSGSIVYDGSRRKTNSNAGNRWWNQSVTEEPCEPPSRSASASTKPPVTTVKPTAQQTSEPLKPALEWTYGNFRTAIHCLHKEHLLEPTKSVVEAIRGCNVNVIAVDQYDFILRTLMKADNGSFVVRSCDQWDIILDLSHCAAIADQLQISLDTVMEASLLHEMGHVTCAEMNPDYYDSEFGAWAAGAILRGRIGTISEQSYRRIWEFCENQE